MVDEDREMRVSLLDKGDNFQIELLNPNSGKKEKCLLNNASRSGMFLKTEHLKETGQIFNFQIKNDSKKSVSGRLHVKWVRPEPSGPYHPRGIGVQVLEFYKETHTNWLKLIEKSVECIRLADLISDKLVAIPSETPVKEVMTKLAANSESTAIIIDENWCPLGSFGHREFLKYRVQKDFLRQPVSKFMTEDIETIDITKGVHDAACFLKNHRLSVAPVTEHDRLVGVINITNVLPFWWEVNTLKQRRLEANLRSTMDVILHDLRNPLANIQATNNLLRDGFITMEEYVAEKMPEIIDHNCNSLEGLIRDMRVGDATSDITAGIIRRKFPLQKVINPTLKSFSNLAQKKGIEFIQDIHDYQETLYADEKRLEQVLSNIISNAIKYTTKGSWVKISTRATQGQMMIHVADGGQGIKEAELPYVFDEYCNISSIPTGGEESTGLGLSIAKRIIEAHDGRIEVKSTLGEGSCFIIYLPLAI